MYNLDVWYILLAEIFFLSLFVIIRAPRQWFKNKLFLVLFTIIHSIGITSVIILLWFFYKMENQTLKEIIIKIETIYFSFLIFSFVLSIFRDFIFYATRHVKNMKIRNAFLSPNIFWIVVAVLSCLYLIPGFRNADDIVKTTYKIESDKIDNFKIALVSDLHIGAGANSKNLDDMVKIVNDMNADCLMICGDIVDSSTSINDLNYLKQSLMNIKTKYGIYVVDGNHDNQCRYDSEQYLLDAGVIFLHNETDLINDNIAIIGLCDKNEGSISEIKKENKIDNEYTIVLKHKPINFRSIQDDADLILCGHTHGYQYPFTAVLAPFFDMRQGIKSFDNMIGITTCGLSQWGYHSKWPSHSEVVEVIIN